MGLTVEKGKTLPAGSVGVTLAVPLIVALVLPGASGVAVARPAVREVVESWRAPVAPVASEALQAATGARGDVALGGHGARLVAATWLKKRIAVWRE